MSLTNIHITNQKLLETALTHRSYLNEHRSADEHNERLEFLGDAVLELAVSEFLYTKFPDKPEGKLTAYRAALVRTGSLAKQAKILGLGDRLRLSKGEASSGGRTNISLLANTFEAVIGAMYLSDGYDAVVGFLNQNLFPTIDDIIKQQLFKDYKSSLQEIVQSQGNDSPNYEVLEEIGPDHDKMFTVVVIVNGNKLGTGTGKSKQQAQQDAARVALENINTN